MIIERTKDEVIIRLPGDINIDDLQDMADWFQYIEIARKSKATQKGVDVLVKQVKKDVGKELRPTYLNESCC